MHKGDKIIIITYADYENEELEGFSPTIVHVDTANRIVDEQVAKLEAELTSR